MSGRALLLGIRGGGGEEVFLRDLAATPPEGWTYDLILDDHASTDGARARTIAPRLFNRLLHPFLWPLPGVRGWTVDDRFDLVHVHNIASLLKLPGGMPVIFSAGGGGYPHYLRRYLGWSRERVLDRYDRARSIHGPLGIRSEVGRPGSIDRFVVFSPFAARELTDIDVDEARIRIVPPGFDLPAPTSPDRSDRPFRVLLFGRDPERKGADLALDAVGELRTAGMDVELRLVGDPTFPEWSCDWVLGDAFVERDRLQREVLPAADVVLVPSRAEGFGFAAVEAMAAQRPLIVSDRDALPWIVGDGGLAIPVDSPAPLVEAIRMLAQDRKRRDDMARAGRARFEVEFTRIVARRRMAAVYEDALSELRL